MSLDSVFSVVAVAATAWGVYVVAFGVWVFIYRDRYPDFLKKHPILACVLNEIAFLPMMLFFLGLLRVVWINYFHWNEGIGLYVILVCILWFQGFVVWDMVDVRLAIYRKNKRLRQERREKKSRARAENG